MNATTNDSTPAAPRSSYDEQAEAFLAKYGLRFRATLTNSKTPAWADDKYRDGDRNHYRVTLSGTARRLVFDFWGSISDARENKHPRAYNVLACISGDANTSDSFADFCAEYGENEDSIKARQLWTRCDRFAKRLRAFFTADELEALSAIA